MDIQQLELPLWSQLQSARLAPQVVDLIAVLDQTEIAIAQLPEREQMPAAAEAMLQLAQLCSLRAEVLITEWEDAYRDPVVSGGFFADIVRQTMAVDLSDLMEPAPPRKRRSKSTLKGETSLAAVVDKSAVLAMVEQLEAESQASELPLSDEQKKHQALVAAHDEDISGWSQAIALVMQQSNRKVVSLMQLQQALEMPLIVIWLCLLLGGIEQYQWQTGGEFYHDAGELWLREVRVQELGVRG